MFIRAIFIVILTFIYAFCNAQSENIITYGTNQQESASNILKLPDGTLLIGARSSTNKFELLHIQNNGIVLNQVQLENTRSITQLILLSDNNISRYLDVYSSDQHSCWFCLAWWKQGFVVSDSGVMVLYQVGAGKMRKKMPLCKKWQFFCFVLWFLHIRTWFINHTFLSYYNSHFSQHLEVEAYVEGQCW